jgi:site-specific DNA-methyltransferase (adenine-specific)
MSGPAVDTVAARIGIGLTRQHHVPDILDAIAALSSDAIPTPPVLARALLDLLPDEVWSNPDYRWLNPATKSGSILREVARRLMVGLEGWEPDPQKRAEHILRNMLFGVAITQVHGDMTRRSVYVSRDATGPHSAITFDTSDGNLPFIEAEHDFSTGKAGRKSKNCNICGAPERLDRGTTRENYAYAFIHGAYPTEEMSDMKFDVIVGNPPYQIGDKKNEDDRAAPVYQHFISQAIALEPKYLAMIVPSRWFTGGFGLDKFRSDMISDRRLAAIVDNPKLYDCFPGVKIEGGVNYFLWDRDYDGDCEFSTRIDGNIISSVKRDLREGAGIVIRDNKAASIVERVVATHKGEWCDSTCSPQMPFGQMRTNFSGDTPQRVNPSDVPVVLSTRAGYVDASNIEKNHSWIDRWKVLLPMAYKSGKSVDSQGRLDACVYGEPIALAPGSACTQTYLVAGMFDTMTETQNFAYFLATKFVQFLVLQRKTTQHIYSDRFRFVPSLSMKSRWTDKRLYAHFGLSEDEIEHIEASIKPRSVNLSLDSMLPASHLPGGVKYRPRGKESDEDESDSDSVDELI